MNDRETLKLALEALDAITYRIERDLEHDHEWAVVERELASEAIIALHERLAQPEPTSGNFLMDAYNEMVDKKRQALEQPECNPHPDAPHGFNRESSHSLGRYVCDCEGWEPEQEWQGLTDEEIAEGARQSWVDKQAFESAVWWAESKLREKNGF